MSNYISKVDVAGVSALIRDSEARTLIANETTARSKKDSELENSISAIHTDISAIHTDISALKYAEYYPNVKKYGAAGNGTTDDYAAFKAAFKAAGSGSFIIVPHGNYLLSADPDDGSKPVTWLFDNGATFKGAGVGDKNTGAGTFGSTYITNPWLVTSGTYQRVTTNGIACPTGGAILAMSQEMDPVVYNSENGSHDWRVLLYQGADTGKYHAGVNVEIINQVMNLRGNKGIMNELDLNEYSSASDWSTALFITGGGDTRSECVAIDIQRDSWDIHWANAISIRQADTALFIDQTQNGIVMNRRSTSGNAFLLRTEDGSSELCAIGVDGWVRCKGINFTDSGLVSGGYLTVRVNGADYKIAVKQ